MPVNRLTISSLVAELAHRSGLDEDQVKAVLRAQSAAIYTHVAQGVQVPIPGLGIVERVEKPGRDMVVTAGPDRGKGIHLGGMQILRVAINWVAAGVTCKGEPPPADVLAINPFTKMRPRSPD
jgi:nucleoid DNA-binding protein